MVCFIFVKSTPKLHRFNKKIKAYLAPSKWYSFAQAKIQISNPKLYRFSHIPKSQITLIITSATPKSHSRPQHKLLKSYYYTHSGPLGPSLPVLSLKKMVALNEPNTNPNLYIYIYIYIFKTLIILESYYYTHTQILLQKACC